MPGTGPLTVSNVNWTAVTALSFCTAILVNESRGASGFPNGDWYVLKPISPDKQSVGTPDTSPKPVRRQSGSAYTFLGAFTPGMIAGYLKMVNSVTTTFDQDESGSPT